MITLSTTGSAQKVSNHMNKADKILLDDRFFGESKVFGNVRYAFGAPQHSITDMITLSTTRSAQKVSKHMNKADKILSDDRYFGQSMFFWSNAQ